MEIDLSIKDDALYYRESPSDEWAFVCTIYELTEEGMYKHKMKNMIEQIKELRIRIDGLYQLTKELKPITIKDSWIYDAFNPEKEPTQDFNSQEIEDAAKSLLLAKAWLGKLLGELGGTNPYSAGKKEVKDIEPTADTAQLNRGISEYSNIEVQSGINPSEIFNAEIYKRKNHIEKVDWLRNEINKTSLALLDMKELNELPNLLAVETSLVHLHEAKMWLGFEFGRLRDEV